MTKTEVNRLIAAELDCSPRTVEGWRSGVKAAPTLRFMIAAMESLESGGAPVRVGRLEVTLREVTAGRKSPSDKS